MDLVLFTKIYTISFVNALFSLVSAVLCRMFSSGESIIQSFIETGNRTGDTQSPRAKGRAGSSLNLVH